MCHGRPLVGSTVIGSGLDSTSLGNEWLGYQRQAIRQGTASGRQLRVRGVGPPNPPNPKQWRVRKKEKEEALGRIGLGVEIGPKGITLSLWLKDGMDVGPT